MNGFFVGFMCCYYKYMNVGMFFVDLYWILVNKMKVENLGDCFFEILCIYENCELFV